MLSLYLVLATLHEWLQLVLRKTNKLGDTKHNNQWSKKRGHKTHFPYDT